MQGMLAIIQCRILCLPVCYPKILKIRIYWNYNFACCFVWIWNLVAHFERDIGWGCLRIGCWGEYLVLRQKRWQGSWENYIMRSLMIYTLHPILFIIIIIYSIVPSFRNTCCLWVLSTSVYQLLGTLVHPTFYPLPWLPIFSSCFSVFLSSCFLEGTSPSSFLNVWPVYLNFLFLISKFIYPILFGW